MKIHVLQHVAFEGPAAIADWAADRGHRLDVRRLDLRGAAALPASAEVDALVVMGGPMSVNDHAALPWVVPERRLVRQVIDAGRPVFGVCLGAQFIAAAMGSAVYPSAEKEIGWFEARRVPGDSPFAAELPEVFCPLHWHGETFDLPPGATRLAESPACCNQAFCIGRHVLGLQFHLEATPASAAELVENAADDITGGTWQQAPQAIRNCHAQSAATRPILDALLDRLLGGQA
ncbi:MAG: type 1 glutamine amidotransferase [Phycisphaerae bacterium]